MTENPPKQTQEHTESLIIAKNKTPKKKPKGPPRKRNSNNPLTQEEVAKLINAVTKLRDKVFLELGFNAGMRISEIASISLININWGDGIITVWDEKKDRYRAIMVPTATMNSLRMLINEKKSKGDRLFPISKKTGERIIQHWTTTILGLEKVKSWHCVRHTYVTISRDNNQDIKIVQENTGDALSTLLKIYAHLTPQKKREMVDSNTVYKENAVAPARSNP